MATVPPIQAPWRNGYPTTDGKPMAETDWHRDLMTALIETLKARYADNDRVYVSGDLLLFYEPGNKRRHVAPDVFVVKDVPRHDRPNYLMWQEGKGPDVVIEVTSSSTRSEDVKKKFRLYRDTLRVKEYFLFDPLGDYLKPPLQGYRLRSGQYQAIHPVEGRLASRVLGLHLERNGKELRLYDPDAGRWLPTNAERAAQETTARQQAERARQQAEAALHQEAAARQQAERARQQAEEAREQEAAARQQEAAARQQEAAARQQAEAEAERLRQELEALRRSPRTRRR